MPLRPFMRIMAVVNPVLMRLGLVMWFIADVDEYGLTPARVVGVRFARLPKVG